MQDRLRRVADGPVLALPDAAAEPDQLVRRGLQRRRRWPPVIPIWLQRDLRGQLDGLRPQHPQPGAEHRRLARPGHAVPLPAARARAVQAQHRVGRVREHRRLGRALLRHRDRARHAPAAARRRGAAAPLDDARAGRLLDARRLPELGHRLQLRALAPDEEVRARPAGADRDRGRRPAVALARRGVVGQAPARDGLRAVRAQAARRRRRRARAVLSAQAEAAVEPAGDLRRLADGRQRRAARSPPGCRRRAGAEPPRCTRSTPARRPPGRDHAASTTPRSPPSPTARTRTAGSTSRGSTTAARRSPRRSARACPRASASSRATAAAGSASPRRGPACEPARPAAAAAARAARRRQRRLDPAPVRRPVRRPARDRAGSGRRRSRRAVDLHVPPQLDRRRVDGAARPPAGAAAPRRCSRAPAASGRPSGRSCATGRRCRSPSCAAREGRRRLLGPERALGLRRRAARPRQGRDRLDRPAATASRRRPTPGRRCRSG